MKILLATDGSKSGTAASEALKTFAIGSCDEIKIISIIDMQVPLSIDIYGGYVPDTTELEKIAKDNAAKVLDEASARIKGYFPEIDVRISTEVLFGTPESRIVETAEEMHADLIVVGSHGYNRWERLLLGSVSDSVVHHAHCSVFIVRTESD
jgi:nucleotide-binding universal stress UspA family protein